MGVGSERGTTHLDVLSVDQLLVNGSIVGSVLTVGTETISNQSIEASEYIAGTIVGTYGNITNVNVKGTLTGTSLYGSTAYFADLYGSKVDAKGALTGSTIVGTIVSGSSIVGTQADISSINVKGTISGSYLVGSGYSAGAGIITGTTLNVTTANAPTINASGTITGTYLNGSIANVPNVNVAGSVVGSAITGSGFSAAAGVVTGDLHVKSAGTITGTYLNGSIANLQNVNTSGSIKGSVILGSSLENTSGTTTGSMFKGTWAGDFLGSTVRTNDMLFYTSGAVQVTTTPATCTHGLGGVPTVAIVVPNVLTATGNVKLDGVNLAAGTSWFTITSNETATATAYAWM